MDGVCTDFVKSCINAHNLNLESTLLNWKKNYPGEFRAYKVLGITNSLFWKKIDEQGEDFWVNLDEYPWFWDLYSTLKSIGEVIFLTTPSSNPCSLSGKLKWLQKRFGSNFKDYILTPHKHLLAGKNSFLIDDYPVNIEKFTAHGGKGILFPQYWNTANDVSDKINYVLTEIERLN